MLVHLKPAPVVARVMTATAVLHDDLKRWLAREVAVGAFLAGTDLVVEPTDILPPGPHERDGLWMTLWKFVEHDKQAPPPQPRELGGSLRALHAALAGFPGDLAPLSGIRDWLGRCSASCVHRPVDPAQIESLRVELEALTPSVFESSLPARRSTATSRWGICCAPTSGLRLERPRGRVHRPRRVGCGGARLERQGARAERGSSSKRCSPPTASRAPRAWRPSSRRTLYTRASGRPSRARNSVLLKGLHELFLAHGGAPGDVLLLRPLHQLVLAQSGQVVRAAASRSARVFSSAAIRSGNRLGLLALLGRLDLLPLALALDDVRSRLR